jgi:hypothetical protein
MTDELSKLEPQIEPLVVSRADPDRADLLQARADVQSHPHLQELFRQKLPHLASRLADELRKMWPHGDPTDAAQFLADEYDQIGPRGIQIINTETGRIAAILSEEDLYQPAMVPREGGGQARPLMRIRPDLESAIVTWFHDKDREERVLQVLAERGHQTELLKEMGDPRLLVATRRGRKHIVDELSKLEPQVLLEAAGGTSGAFLRLFQFGEPPEGHGLTRLAGTALSKSSMGVSDMTTTNLHHNRPATLQGALVQGWVRIIAETLVLAAREPQGVIDVTRDSKLPGNFWIVHPDTVRSFRALDGRAVVLPVAVRYLDGLPTAITVEAPLGYLKVPKAFEALSREIFDRWETGAELDFEVWVDLEKVRAYTVVGIDPTVQVL